MKLKIAIVVHGRFHAFDLVRALLARGHEVTLFTNYPKWAVKRFGISAKYVESFWVHGILSRIAWKLHDKLRIPYPEAWVHRSFGRWAAKKVKGEHWDLIHGWSGVSEELLETREKTGALHTLMRGSAHIRTQTRLLQEEAIRTNSPQDCPSTWMIAREEREYAKTDKLVVLSSFAHATFIEAGIAAEKLVLNPLGVEVSHFRPPLAVVEERCRRILSGAPLRILYVGAMSFQKGMWDIAKVVHQMPEDSFQFRFVGPQPAETSNLLQSINYRVEIISKQPQNQLPTQYTWGDIFVFPTIQDGFASVLAQANASGLPILTTSNCGGPDLIQEGVTGWVVPIRNSDAIIERLRWCNSHRKEVATMVNQIYVECKLRTWLDTAADFEALIQTEHPICSGNER